MKKILYSSANIFLFQIRCHARQNCILILSFYYNLFRWKDFTKIFNTVDKNILMQQKCLIFGSYQAVHFSNIVIAKLFCLLLLVKSLLLAFFALFLVSVLCSLIFLIISIVIALVLFANAFSEKERRGAK